MGGSASSLTLSRRVDALVDAYEVFVVVKSVLDTIDGCEHFLRRRRKSYCTRQYFVLPDLPEIRPRLWFVEASLEAEATARAAVATATETYAAAFAQACRGRADLARVVVGLGLPSSAAIALMAQERVLRQPWWRRIASAPLEGKVVWDRRPEPGDCGHDEVYCVNDPVDAMKFWRGDLHRNAAQ